MSHFYAHIQGNKGRATRCGSKGSGMEAHIRGWNIGVWVRLSHDEKTGRDFVQVMKTGGSHNTSVMETLAEFHEETAPKPMKEAQVKLLDMEVVNHETLAF